LWEERVCHFEPSEKSGLLQQARFLLIIDMTDSMNPPVDKSIRIGSQDWGFVPGIT
jgi:hypothetical protein